MDNPAPIPPVVLNGHLPVQDIDLSDVQPPRKLCQWPACRLWFTVHRPPRGHRCVFGHPSGRAFRSMTEISEHVVSIIQDKLDNCPCRLCQPGVWKHSQLEKHRARRAGAITTHLPPVPPAAPAAPTVP
ncbi:hypothetical protein D6D25_08172 [Aureobasidium pullulans]|nr:hypothetical protein D6D25_08172 [Aureobasidium pullulans]